jgi:hypothetical protein
MKQFVVYVCIEQRFFCFQSELRTIPEEMLQKIKWELEQELGIGPALVR